MYTKSLALSALAVGLAAANYDTYPTGPTCDKDACYTAVANSADSAAWCGTYLAGGYPSAPIKDCYKSCGSADAMKKACECNGHGPTHPEPEPTQYPGGGYGGDDGHGDDDGHNGGEYPSGGYPGHGDDDSHNGGEYPSGGYTGHGGDSGYPPYPTGGNGGHGGDYPHPTGGNGGHGGHGGDYGHGGHDAYPTTTPCETDAGKPTGYPVYPDHSCPIKDMTTTAPCKSCHGGYTTVTYQTYICVTSTDKHVDTYPTDYPIKAPVYPTTTPCETDYPVKPTDYPTKPGHGGSDDDYPTKPGHGGSMGGGDDYPTKPGHGGNMGGGDEYPTKPSHGGSKASDDDSSYPSKPAGDKPVYPTGPATKPTNKPTGGAYPVPTKGPVTAGAGKTLFSGAAALVAVVAALF